MGDAVLQEKAAELERSAGTRERSADNLTDSADRRTELAADCTTFAAERTYAAWARTGLIALASGIGARKLLDDIVRYWMSLTNTACWYCSAPSASVRPSVKDRPGVVQSTFCLIPIGPFTVVGRCLVHRSLPAVLLLPIPPQRT